MKSHTARLAILSSSQTDCHIRMSCAVSRSLQCIAPALSGFCSAKRRANSHPSRMGLISVLSSLCLLAIAWNRLFKGSESRSCDCAFSSTPCVRVCSSLISMVLREVWVCFETPDDPWSYLEELPCFSLEVCEMTKQCVNFPGEPGSGVPIVCRGQITVFSGVSGHGVITILWESAFPLRSSLSSACSALVFQYAGESASFNTMSSSWLDRLKITSSQ